MDKPVIKPAKEGALHHETKQDLRFMPLVKSALRQEKRSFVDANNHANANVITVASYNVHKCVGLDRRFDPARTAAVIAELDADIVALQEVDQRFGQRMGLLDLRLIEHQTGLVPVGAAGMRDSHGWHGNIVLARNAVVKYFSPFNLPGAEPRGALVVDLSLESGPLRIIAAHLGLLRRSREKQIEAILAAADARDGRPALLVGDLNEWRLGNRSSLKALSPTFGPLHANLASFPSRFPLWSLDRILTSPNGLVSKLEVHDTQLARIASDHLPVKALIRLGNSGIKVV